MADPDRNTSALSPAYLRAGEGTGRETVFRGRNHAVR
jgi:hypothetical protein